ncbi:predicted protein [Plenodomus lingam JN3]|uniref:Predicted protein n=1 Tax=Leptosphaeria maculans (strain JN3 / isolate v23.1.3 / race Av1-4-5-6-7-8) TaxID=985895 RepID=E4ZX55_LEPMJ|nr:predicted protein [Plenodomus lingam JN3]CBX95265.1 predicted protein [Plenodomus lingam JN3]
MVGQSHPRAPRSVDYRVFVRGNSSTVCDAMSVYSMHVACFRPLHTSKASPRLAG